MPVSATAATGILLHEAVGHGLKADFNRKATLYSQKKWQTGGQPLVTVIDDGRPDIGLDHNHGSLTVDDEGTITQETVLIDQGVMCGCMSDN